VTDLSARRVVDLSVPVAEHLPASWPTHVPFQHQTYTWFGRTHEGPGAAESRLGSYATRWMAIDEHTGTHLDAPSHFIPPPGSGLDFAGEWGDVDVDGVPLTQLIGPAAVIDVPELEAEPGISPLLEPEHVLAWEVEHGALQLGEIVLLRSGWDRHYLPGAAGDAYIRDAVVHSSAPAWPSPSVATVELLLDRGVRCLGTDGASMGPAQGGQAVHVAALGRGAVFVECLAQLAELPHRGATFVFLPLKVLGATGAPGRAVAFLPSA